MAAENKYNIQKLNKRSKNTAKQTKRISRTLDIDHHHLFAQNRSWTTRPNMRHLQLPTIRSRLWSVSPYLLIKRLRRLATKFSQFFKHSLWLYPTDRHRHTYIRHIVWSRTSVKTGASLPTVHAMRPNDAMKGNWEQKMFSNAYNERWAETAKR